MLYTGCRFNVVIDQAYADEQNTSIRITALLNEVIHFNSYQANFGHMQERNTVQCKMTEAIRFNQHFQLSNLNLNFHFCVLCLFPFQYSIFVY